MLGLVARLLAVAVVPTVVLTAPVAAQTPVPAPAVADWVGTFHRAAGLTTCRHHGERKRCGPRPLHKTARLASPPRVGSRTVRGGLN